MTTSKAQAATELLRRRLSRRRLVAFTEYTNPSYRPGKPHHIIATACEAVLRGDITRLIIEAPPRHGKTELFSRRLPALALGMNPADSIISATYNMDKAEEVGGEVRDIFRSAQYQTLFPNVTLKDDTRAKGHWRTQQGGQYVAAGIGTALTGRGKLNPLMIIDDPFKDRAEADSEKHRHAAKAWYAAVAQSRMPRAIILGATRWHEDDLTGWLLDGMENGGDVWHRITLPAISDTGEACWPEEFPVERLEALRKSYYAMGMQREWWSLYQQKPQPEEGTYFQIGWFKRYNIAPKDLAVFGTSDYAVKDGAGDYTVHRVWGIAPNSDIYLLDGWRGQTSSDVWIEKLCDLIKKWNPQGWFGEGGVIQHAIEPYLMARALEREAFTWHQWLPSINDKPTRARAIQARAAMGLIYVPNGACGMKYSRGLTSEYLGSEWIDEMVRFPTGKWDDEVDAASLLGRALAEANPALTGQPQRRPDRQDYQPQRGRGGRRDDGDWKVA